MRNAPCFADFAKSFSVAAASTHALGSVVPALPNTRFVLKVAFSSFSCSHPRAQMVLAQDAEASNHFPLRVASSDLQLLVLPRRIVPQLLVLAYPSGSVPFRVRQLQTPSAFLDNAQFPVRAAYGPFQAASTSQMALTLPFLDSWLLR